MKLLNRPHYEDSFALAACFWLDDEHAGWVGIRLLLRHYAISYLLVSFFVLARAVLNYLVQVCGVQPRMGEEAIMLLEFFAEPAQMHAKCVLASDIIHSQEVVNSLKRLHLGEEIRLDSKVLPPDLPLEFSGLELLC